MAQKSRGPLFWADRASHRKWAGPCQQNSSTIPRSSHVSNTRSLGSVLRRSRNTRVDPDLRSHVFGGSPREHGLCEWVRRTHSHASPRCRLTQPDGAQPSFSDRNSSWPGFQLRPINECLNSMAEAPLFVAQYCLRPFGGGHLRREMRIIVTVASLQENTHSRRG